MSREAEVGQVLKPNRSGAKYVGVAAKQTHDAFAPNRGGGVSRFEHGHSRCFAGRTDQAGIHPRIDIALGVANRPATVLEELRSTTDATQLFEVGRAKSGVGSALRRIESRIASVRQRG